MQPATCVCQVESISRFEVEMTNISKLAIRISREWPQFSIFFSCVDEVRRMSTQRVASVGSIGRYMGAANTHSTNTSLTFHITAHLPKPSSPVLSSVRAPLASPDILGPPLATCVYVKPIAPLPEPSGDGVLDRSR